MLSLSAGGLLVRKGTSRRRVRFFPIPSASHYLSTTQSVQPGSQPHIQSKLFRNPAHLDQTHPKYSEEAVVSWSNVAVHWYSIELGSDSQQVSDMRGIVARPQSHPAWGGKDALQVGGPLVEG